MELTANTDEEQLRTLGLPDRASETRRRNLERIGSLCTDRNVELTVRLSEEEALARPTPHDDDAYEILIPQREYEQVDLEMPARLWDRTIQVAFLFHELGHVHYSDFERFGEVKEGLDTRWRELFRTIYNAAEDGVIETQIASEFNVTDDLFLLNETLAERADRRHRKYVELFEMEAAGEPVQSYTVLEALSIGLLDRGYVNSGRFDAILDDENLQRVILGGHDDALRELVADIDEFMTRMLSEPDGASRVEYAAEFFETARSVFESLPPLQRRRVQTVPVKPPDTQACESWSSKPATHLPSRERARQHVQTTQADGRSNNGQGEQGGPPGTPAESCIEQSTHRRTIRQRSGSSQSSSPLVQEAQRLLTLVRDENTDISSITVVEPADDGGDRGRWQAAGNGSQQLVADLRTRLRRERRPRDSPGYRVGRLNDRRVVAGYNGEQRVFTRRETGGRKDYSCILVLDRSGSMAGDVVETAEKAVGQLAHALFQVGVDVSVLSLWQGHACLELPFGAAPKENIGRLMTGRAAGGTPLGDAVTVASERIGMGRGSYPFVIVVTDGYPNDAEKYRNALDSCTFPVFGVYVGSRPADDTAYFDRVVHTERVRLGRTLRQLIRQLFTGEL